MPVLGKTTIAKNNLVETVDLSDPDIDTDSWKWNRITDQGGNTLPSFSHGRMLEIALYLYRFNPLAHRGVELMRDYVVGGGIRIKSPSPTIKKVIEKFWNNPIHNLDHFIPQLAFELSLYGEMTVPATVNEHNGDVSLSYISPFSVSKVILNPRNHLQTLRVKLKGLPDEENDLDIIRLQTDPTAQLGGGDHSPSTFQRRMGDGFYFAVNRVGDEERGLSDLLAVADFVDCLDQLIFSSLERMTHETGWVWDVKMTGAGENQINQQRTELESRPPKPGAFMVHNEFVDWKPMEVGLKARNISDEASLIRNYALGGMGLPVHFFTEPSSAGRAIAESMAAPSYQSLRARQVEIKGFIRQMLDFVIDQKIVHGMIEEGDRSFDVIMPKISLRSLQRTGGAMRRITQSLETAEEKNWLEGDQGKRIFQAMVEQLDLGVTLDEVG